MAKAPLGDSVVCIESVVAYATVCFWPMNVMLDEAELGPSTTKANSMTT